MGLIPGGPEFAIRVLLVCLGFSRLQAEEVLNTTSGYANSVSMNDMNM